MSAGRYNFEIEAGATFSRTITYTDATDTPVDLSGAVLRMQIRDNYSAPTAAVSIDSAGNGITMIPVQGQFTITLTPAQTESIEFRQGVYDIEIEYSQGTVERVLEGRVKIKSQVTQ